MQRDFTVHECRIRFLYHYPGGGHTWIRYACSCAYATNWTHISNRLTVARSMVAHMQGCEARKILSRDFSTHRA